MEYHLLFAAFLIFLVYVIFSAGLIITENRDPAATLAWILVIFLLPIVGILIYVFFGRNWRIRSEKKILAKKIIREKIEKALRPQFEKESFRLGSFCEVSSSDKLLCLIRNSCLFPFSLSNKADLLQSGSQKFSRLISDLEKAEVFIHMEYFIWRDDPLTEKIKSILLAKVLKGVEIRIVLDPLGSFFLPRSFLKELRSAGIQVIFFFNSLSPLKFTTINHLLHRKLVIIDGTVGYTGGMNMGEEYIDGGEEFPFWRDTHLRFEGEAVLVLQAMFAENWNEVTGQDQLFSSKYFPETALADCPVPVFMVSSGPDSPWDSIRQTFFSMIMLAQKSVAIQTPYFVPDPSIQEALKAAALSGVKVRLMITGRTDKLLPYWTAFTYYRELLEAGVRIFHYQKGFLHCKTVNIDQSICTVGSTNLDIRSFHIDHEINAVIFHPPTAKQLLADFENDLSDCREFTLKDYARLSPLSRFRNSLFRLLAPLL